MRLLILGGTGMLGHKLFQRIGRCFSETYATVRGTVGEAPFNRIPFFHTGKVIEGVDACDFSRLAHLIHDIRPDVVINCVGIIKQRKSDLSPVPSITLNALLPHRLCDMTASYGGRVIHFSTDCVFDGKKGRYTEEDSPNAQDMYGRTKALGELTVAENGLTIRTSIIGRELKRHVSLLDWFLSQVGKPIKGFTKAIYSGVTTVEMVKVVIMVLEKHFSLTGLYHVVAEPISKHNLLCLAREKFGISVTIEPDDVLEIDRSMHGEKFERATGYRAPSWPELMQELVDDSKQYRKWGIGL